MSDPVLDPDEPQADQRRRRLLFRATHRGTHELDLLIGGFVSSRLAAFSPGELTEIEQLLDLPEPDLAAWLTGRQPVPPDVESPLLRAMVQAAWR